MLLTRYMLSEGYVEQARVNFKIRGNISIALGEREREKSQRARRAPRARGLGGSGGNRRSRARVSRCLSQLQQDHSYADRGADGGRARGQRVDGRQEERRVDSVSA